MIPPHSARTDATEGKTGLARMEYAVIYSYSTGRSSSDYVVRPLLVIVEIVECERVWSRINICKCFLHATVFHNREYRSKDFLVHDRHVVAYISEQGGRKNSSRNVALF